MRYFDLHCDTLCECVDKKVGLYNNQLHVDLNKAKSLNTYFQCCAAFISDKYRGQKAVDRFYAIYNALDKSLICKSKQDIEDVNKNSGIGLIPTIESGAALGGDLENIDKFSKLGVKMITLTWNGDNELGGGIENNNKGLTSFGKEAISLFENKGIILDLSHASQKLFDDVCAFSTKAFVASHSNAQRLCNHKRNLNDEQAKEIIRRGGLIGINFYVEFLENNPENSSIKSIVNHIEHFIRLGGAKAIAFGSDFDGAAIPDNIKGVVDVPKIHQALKASGHSSNLTEDVFYGNALRFLLKSY